MFTPSPASLTPPSSISAIAVMWLTCEAWSRQTLVLLALWIIRWQVILYLAGLQGIAPRPI